MIPPSFSWGRTAFPLPCPVFDFDKGVFSHEDHHPREAVSLIKDGDTVDFGGLGAYGAPDTLEKALADRYGEEGHPRNIVAVGTLCTGKNNDEAVGMNRLSADGLIAAHYKNPMTLEKKVGQNAFAAYTLPLGIVVKLMRAGAARQPGVLTRVGLGTYIDPRNDGPAANEKAREQDLYRVRVLPIDGENYLFYPSIDLDVCILRASYADEKGNLCFTKEVSVDASLEMAMAVHNNGGTVIAEVQDILRADSIPPRNVRIFHTLVDYVVKMDMDLYWQGYADRFRPELCGEVQVPMEALAPLPLDIRKVIARRAAMELRSNSVINLDIGIPSGVGSVANEEGIADMMTLSLETGPTGGVPMAGLGFGGAANPEMIATILDNFDFYDGGALDLAFLGLAEVDRAGNVNVFKFNGRCAGPGGFIDITQNTRRVCFLGAFTAGKSDIGVGGGQLTIRQSGDGVKFVERVQQITFSAEYARKTGQKVLYITERAVFTLTDRGIVLTEVPPGVDLEKDIFAHMGFVPPVAEELRQMDERLFREAVMGIRAELTGKE